MVTRDEPDRYRPSTLDWVRDQVELYERTQGREGNTVDGRPVVILSTRGARSGAIRKSPVMRLVHGGAYVGVGSVGGLPQHPAWYHNLLADPHCRLRDGADELAMVAREASGRERETLWDEAVAAWAHFAELQERTTRRFPIMVFERDPAGSSPDSPRSSGR